MFQVVKYKLSSMVLNLALFLSVAVLLIGLMIYLFQEKLIFYPEKLPDNYRFSFSQPFEEVDVVAADGTKINALWFKAAQPKGVIVYLHGNAGSLQSWGELGAFYTAMQYDLFIFDYRSYGKSGGKIGSQKQLFSDAQAVYELVKTHYPEEKIVVLGYSIGTGMAAHLASANSPRMLILQAPYYSLTDLQKHYFHYLPSFMLKYKFETNRYIQQCSMPIVLFHGTHDEVIYYESSLKLQQLLKQGDTLISLQGQGHNNISENREYIRQIRKILANEYY